MIPDSGTDQLSVGRALRAAQPHDGSSGARLSRSSGNRQIGRHLVAVRCKPPDDIAFAEDGRLFLGDDWNGLIVWIAPVDLIER